MTSSRNVCGTLLLGAAVLAALWSAGCSAGPQAPEKPNRWEEAIRAFEAQDRKSPPPEDAILFVGSSSIRMWDLKASFPDLPVINRGFGGSEVADSVVFAARIITPYRPRAIVVYAGDNDIAAGKSPEQVFADFQELVRVVRDALPHTPLIYIAIKPSLSRWRLVGKMREANALIRKFTGSDELLYYVDIDAPMMGPDGKPRPELFRSDGLHLNAQGYELWTGLVRRKIDLALAARR